MKKNVALTLVLLIFIILLAVLLVFTYNTAKSYALSDSCLNYELAFSEKNQKNIFSIDKITYFSSANANIATNSNSSFTVSNLYQYTDIAFFINPNSDKLTEKNTLKSVELTDIEFVTTPSSGKPNLYYKNLNDFATSKFSEDNVINSTITFETTSENSIDYSKPVLYNNCANPITICYVNSNIIDNYTLSNDVSNIAHNGALLKSCGITLNSIASKITLNIKITNNLDEIYICPLTLDIPLSTENATIYDGSLTLKDNVDYKFIRIN